MHHPTARPSTFMKILSVAAAGFAAALIGWSPPAQSEIKLGILAPLTGDLQAFGEPTLNGIRLAIEEINADGGVLGDQLDFAVGDTQTLAQAGVDAAQKLVSLEGVAALIGALGSGVTIPIATSVSKVQRVVQISNGSTSPLIATLDDDDFLFRTIPSDAFQGLALAEVTRENGYGKLAVMYINNDYGQGLAESFAEAFKERGGEISEIFAYEPGNASYRGELATAARKSPEALVLIAYPENGITILRQALEEGYFEKFIFTDGMKSPQVADAIGSHLDGTIGTNPQALSDTDSANHFAAAYEARFGAPLEVPFVDSAYDAVYILALAIEKAGTTDRIAIRDTLRSVANPPGATVLPGEWAKAKTLIANGEEVDFVGAAGSHDFDAMGEVSGTFAYWKIDGGKFVTIKVFAPES